jgi:DNA polymerase III epsilon subunit-like protein
MNLTSAMPRLGLCLDWETSGSDWNGGKSWELYQGISFGAIVFNTRTFEEIESIYVELKFDADKYKWSNDAERVHGLSRDYLEKFGVEREEGLVQLAELIVKHFGSDMVIVLGHNVLFDIEFTKQLFADFDMEFRPHPLRLDTSGTCFMTLGINKSDKVFEFFGFEHRDAHNALDDAKMTLQVAKSLKEIFTELLN